MRVCCLGSGSKGNCTYIETPNVKMLIDCGLTVKEIEKRLHQIDVKPEEINTIFITHEHSDHILSLNKFCTIYNIRPVLHHKNVDEIVAKAKLSFDDYKIMFDNDCFIADTKVVALPLSHDSHDCVGYCVSYEGIKVSIITDTGFISNKVLLDIKNSDIVIIEANHNETMLMNNPNYPLELKKRILSKKGHLSNKQCSEYIYQLVKLGCEQFVLAHLSEKNNTPKLAYADITENLLSKDLVEGKHYFLDLAWQDSVGTLYNLKFS